MIGTCDLDAVRDAGEQRVVWSVNFARVVSDVFCWHVCTGWPARTHTATHTPRLHAAAFTQLGTLYPAVTAL